MTNELRFVLSEEPTSLRTVFGGASLVHIVLLIVLVAVGWLRPGQRLSPAEHLSPVTFTMIANPALGGGGGGGGNKRPEPPATDKVAAVRPPEPVPLTSPEPTPPPEPVVAAEVDAVPIESAPALIAAVASESVSPGTGLNGGAGDGPRGGNGLDDGVGLGPGKERGNGGDLYKPGSGSSPPKLRYAPRPNYTPEAMVRHIRGEVHLDCLALATGSVGKCEIVKPLDSNNFGLDAEALRTATQFRFTPATKAGEAIPALVRIVLEFNLR
jgi:TonB family protein